MGSLVGFGVGAGVGLGVGLAVERNKKKLSSKNSKIEASIINQ